MSREYVELLVKFCKKIIKYSKKNDVRIQAMYHLPTDDFLQTGWILCADYRDNKGKWKEISIFLEDE